MARDRSSGLEDRSSLGNTGVVSFIAKEGVEQSLVTTGAATPAVTLD